MKQPASLPFEAESAGEICRTLELAEESRDLLSEGMTPADFLQALREKKLLEDALKFLCHAMPRREAVWWGCLCIRGVLEKSPDPAVAAAVEAAERWVGDPSEENRRATGPLAEAANHSGLGGLAAMAVLHSERESEVETGWEASLTGSAVYGIVMLTVAAEKPRWLRRRYRSLLEQGLDVLSRGIRR